MSAAVVELHDGYVGYLVHGNTEGGAVEDDDDADGIKRAKRDSFALTRRRIISTCPSNAAGTEGLEPAVRADRSHCSAG
ncbi:MAG: hypothetical protein OXL97_07760 [Chloroflexota bacterium]|nr:hypothetical protein [Chloroflexota bacterium]MDE2883798.1 hypothetical protein [Chloroflexota bacterium]